MSKGTDAQPVSKVVWVKRDSLRANDYNPNHVAVPELKLLKTSILADGWTQPIVARPDGEIVDGFHRWTIAADPEIAALTGGLVPVVYVEPDPANQMASTVRHNRARGSHHVLRMASIVRAMIDQHGMTEAQVQEMMGMEAEEVLRLYDRGGMPDLLGDNEFGKGWVPK